MPGEPTKMTTLHERESPERVLVVLDGFKVFTEERGLAPLHWAMLNIIRADDELLVLIALNYLPETTSSVRGFLRRLLRSSSSRNKEESLGGRERYHTLLQRMINERRETYIRILRPFFNTCMITGVKFQAKLVAGNQPIELVIKEVNIWKMTWLVVDRCLMEYCRLLNCCRNLKVALVNNKEVEFCNPSPRSGDRSQVHPVYNMNLDQEATKLAKEAFLSEEHHIRDSLPLLRCQTQSLGFSQIATTKEDDLRGDSELALELREAVRLGWDEIVEMTEGFQSERCITKHEGTEMYHGTLRSIAVSVKRVTGNVENVIEAEKRIAMSVFHCNILRMIGYYSENSNVCAFVYPCVARYTLADYLVGMRQKLSCAERMKIAIGIAQGLRYMHEECPGGPIIHGDLRLHHIYLWHGSQPLISGFQQAKWQRDEVMGMTNCRTSSQKNDSDAAAMIAKSDIFSFGVLLLRLFCQRISTENDELFIEWAQPLLLQGAIHELVDNDMVDLDTYIIYKAISAATVCTNVTPHSRTNMTAVISILRGENSCHVQPSPPSILI